MRIAINTLPFLNNKAGAERYTENILKHIAGIDSENKYFLILSNINRNYYKIIQSNFKKIIYKGNTHLRIIRIFGEQFYIPLIIQRLGIDILFCPCNVMPGLTKVASVVTLHDLHWFILPELYSEIKLLYIRKSIKWSVYKSHTVITCSESSKKDIIAIYGIPDEKVKVIHLGIDPIFRKEENKDEIVQIMNKYEIKGKFILFVGQLHKRKNVVRLITAFRSLKERKIIDHKLVIAGAKGDGYSEIIHSVKAMVPTEVIITGCIPDRDICLLYNAADMMIYPSLYEGFGLPVIEAMACGCPVVTSNISSLPETAGESAILVNPYDISDIARAIETVTTKKALRGNLIEKGFKHASKFLWEKTASSTLKVFEKVYTDMKCRGEAL